MEKPDTTQQQDNRSDINTKEYKELKQFISQVLSSEVSQDKKIEQLATKYFQNIRANKQLEKELAASAKKLQDSSRETDRLNNELAKSIGGKARLENLCRELQKAKNNAIDTSKRVETEDTRKRLELSTHFTKQLEDIQNRLEEQKEDRIRVTKENDMLREKFHNIYEQYELREKHFETQLKAKDIESQLLDAKLAKLAAVASEESKKLRAQLKTYEDTIDTMSKTEKELRSQLTMYSEKFETFQDTLNKSNDVFNTFRRDMEKMSKTIRKNEKENLELRKKCEQTDVALVELADERNAFKKQAESLKIQKKKLEDLCRALQQERKGTDSQQLPVPE